MGILDAAYRLVAETLKTVWRGRSRAWEEFQRTIQSLGENVKIFVAEHDRRDPGCLVSPFSEHTAYNWYCGSRAEPVLGAMHLLHWEAMRQFRALGVKRFDFQGVRIDPGEGLQAGGDPELQEGIRRQPDSGIHVEVPLPRPEVGGVFAGGPAAAGR